MTIRRNRKHLTTADGVIDAVGGTAAAATLTGSSQQSVSNWRSNGRLAPPTFLIFIAELASRGMTAPPSLWGIRAPRRRSNTSSMKC